MSKYILALDQGTSSSRAILFDHEGRIIKVSQREFGQHFPQPGWVEHDPVEIWQSQSAVMADAAAGHEAEIAAIGITNQRETTIVWDAATGVPVYNAIVWQDRRTSELCDSLKAGIPGSYGDPGANSSLTSGPTEPCNHLTSGPAVELKATGLSGVIHRKTGLLIDAYFSGTKIKWILDNVPGARARAERGELRFGTVDSWLVWNLTSGRVHVTDVTNASRTMLFNINTLAWDEELLQLLDIPASMLPKVCSCSEVYGEAVLAGGVRVPIAGIAGDQQAALFGQMCTEPGMVKNTYGTGCFMLLNTGDKPVFSTHNLLSTVAWKVGGTVKYALEGSVFVAGSAVQWLRDGLGVIKHSSDIEALAASVPDNGGVYFVPALTGLGAPYWDANARGGIVGITRGTTAAHIARATEEGIAFQTMDIVDAMRQDAGVELRSLKVDGGASRDRLLMQFQADILGTEVIRPVIIETTALGAAYLAGLAVGFWAGVDELKDLWQAECTFAPHFSDAELASRRDAWHDAVRRTLSSVN